ncbi:hypothetical protein [Dactylosporangium maewongense]
MPSNAGPALLSHVAPGTRAAADGLILQVATTLWWTAGAEVRQRR